MAAKQPAVTQKETLEELRKDAPRVGAEDAPKPRLTDVNPYEGGTYVREKDGTLRRTHAPTEVPATAPTSAEMNYARGKGPKPTTE